MSEKSVPDGWKIVKFGDVARHVKITVNVEESGLERYIGGEHMVTDDLRIKSWGVIGDGYLGPAFHMKFTKGQILYGSRRTYLRKVAIPDFDGICANTTFVIEPKGNMIPELLPFLMQSAGFVENSIKNSKGSTNPYINWKDIAKYEFPLPPIAEQKRIAEVLWAVENTITHVEDSITYAIRTKGIQREYLFSKGIGKHKKYKQTRIGKIPENWNIVQINDVCKEITVGVVINPASHYVKEGVPALRSLNIIEDGFNMNELVYFSEHDNDKTLKKSKLECGDVVIVRTGTPGISCMVDAERAGVNCIDLIIAHPDDNIILSEFLSRYTNSNKCKKQVLAMQTGLAQQHLNIGAYKKAFIPLPDLPEQKEIIGILKGQDCIIHDLNINLSSLINLKKLLLRIMLSDKAENCRAGGNSHAK